MKPFTGGNLHDYWDTLVTSGLFDDPIQVGRYTLYQISLIVRGKHARNRREDMYKEHCSYVI